MLSIFFVPFDLTRFFFSCGIVASVIIIIIINYHCVAACMLAMHTERSVECTYQTNGTDAMWMEFAMHSNAKKCIYIRHYRNRVIDKVGRVHRVWCTTLHARFFFFSLAFNVAHIQVKCRLRNVNEIKIERDDEARAKYMPLIHDDSLWCLWAWWTRIVRESIARDQIHSK